MNFKKFVNCFNAFCGIMLFFGSTVFAEKLNGTEYEFKKYKSGNTLVLTEITSPESLVRDCYEYAKYRNINLNLPENAELAKKMKETTISKKHMTASFLRERYSPEKVKAPGGSTYSVDKKNAILHIDYAPNSTDAQYNTFIFSILDLDSRIETRETRKAEFEVVGEYQKIDKKGCLCTVQEVYNTAAAYTDYQRAKTIKKVIVTGGPIATLPTYSFTGKEDHSIGGESTDAFRAVESIDMINCAVSKIEPNSIYKIEKLTELKLPKTLEELADVDINKNYNELKSLKSIDLSDCKNIKKIGMFFSDCIEKADIPASVKIIHPNAEDTLMMLRGGITLPSSFSVKKPTTIFCQDADGSVGTEKRTVTLKEIYNDSVEIKTIATYVGSKKRLDELNVKTIERLVDTRDERCCTIL